MKLRLSYPLPRDCNEIAGIKGLIHQDDLKIGSSKLRAKLLVFRKCSDLHHFWEKCLDRGSLGRFCRGVVNGLYRQVQEFSKTGMVDEYLEADPRYFCVIGLVKDYLSTEIISHESVHAAFNYVKRIKRSPWDEHAEAFDEEKIAYPAGRITAEINRSLWRAGLQPVQS